ncbi:MAG: glycosyltransferase family 4 protein [Actinobacteria bacterium]|nr:glycosyltransferase family 4 protein [Actinomycetota bacterium]
MRIFHVCADAGIPPDGTKGASVHLRSIAAGLRRLGHDVTMFTARRSAGEAGLPVPARVLSGDASIREAARKIGAPDLVYERYTLGHARGLAAARAFGCPFTLEVNAPLVLEAGRHRPETVHPEDARTEELLFREADVVFAVSEPLRRHVAGIRGTNEGTEVLRNGCDPTLFPVPARLDRALGDVLVFLGHPKPWHGAEALPVLLAELVRRGRDPLLLLIGGGDGADQVLEGARLRGVGRRVIISGPVRHEAAARLLTLGTVAVAPYFPESFFYFCPLKVIESMAAGVPTVSSAIGDIPTIVGDTGMLVPPGDPRALADAVERVLVDEGLRRKLGSAARERAIRRFSWESAARRIERAACSVLQEAAS